MERGIVFLALVGVVGLVLLGSIGCDYIEPFPLLSYFRT